MQNEAEFGNATRKSPKQRLIKKNIKTRRVISASVTSPSKEADTEPVTIPSVRSTSPSGTRAPCPSTSASPIPPSSVLGLPQYMPDALSLSDESEDASDVESFILDNEDLDEVNAAFCAAAAASAAAAGGGSSPPPGNASNFLLSTVAEGLVDGAQLRSIDVETQARLEALLEAAGIGKISATDGKTLADPEILRCLTSSVSSALDEAAAALTRMRAGSSSNPTPLPASDLATSQSFSAQSSRTSAATATPTEDAARPSPAVGSTVGAITSSGAGNGSDSSVSSSASSSSSSNSGSETARGRGDGGVSGSIVTTLAEACSDGDVLTVRRLLEEGHSVHETSEEGESLLSLACSAGYFKLAQILIAMRANVEDRGIKGDCTPLMEAASGGYNDIVKLLMEHGADLNAQSSSGNTPLHYACCGGYEDVVLTLLDAGASIEETNENGHTPLMEAASAGHVGVAKILLERGAGINTHSNEFKESALTLACYKGHLEMVKFLLEAGADQEHKTDEMHTALMEASMDGHVEVAKLLLDHGAEVNMPADSFESPLTLAACGGHVELAMLLIERGANLEEVNDEGYTPLMEASREGHEEMVALLLSQGADINAQTEETQETALTLACCGGFLEVADFLVKAGADLELGCSTPLMEASQEGHLELVQYLIKAGANVNAVTGTGDTALSYACENGHTDVADVLLASGADLEHEAEGGRSPLMKAARAGHLCTVQFLINKAANVNHMTSNNEHSVLSLACAGGHLQVVELLLTHGADPSHRLKDGSTMLIEAAKGGHTGVVQLLLDYPNSVFTASDLPQLTMSPIPVAGSGATVGNASASAGVSNVGQGIGVDGGQGPMEDNIGIPKVPNASSKGNHPGIPEGGSTGSGHHHHHPHHHHHHHPHNGCSANVGGGGGGGGGSTASAPGSCTGTSCKGHHHHQQWNQNVDSGNGNNHHVHSSNAKTSFSKKREGKGERRDSKSGANNVTQNAASAIPLPSQNNAAQGQHGSTQGMAGNSSSATGSAFANAYVNALEMDFSKFTSDWHSKVLKGVMMGDGSLTDGPSLVEVAKLAKEALRSGARAAGVSLGESESILEHMAAAAVASGAIGIPRDQAGKRRGSNSKEGGKKTTVSKDEQIQRKKQILEELQKVEQELQEKAQHQHGSPGQLPHGGGTPTSGQHPSKVNSPSLQSLQLALKEACGELRQHPLSPSSAQLSSQSSAQSSDKELVSSSTGITGVTDSGVERRFLLPGDAPSSELVLETSGQSLQPHQQHQPIVLPQLQLSSEQHQQLQIQLQQMHSLQQMSSTSGQPTVSNASASNSYVSQSTAAGNPQVYQLQYQQQTLDVDPSSAAAVAVVAAQHLQPLQFQNHLSPQQSAAPIPLDYPQYRLHQHPQTSVILDRDLDGGSGGVCGGVGGGRIGVPDFPPPPTSGSSPALPLQLPPQPAPSPSSEDFDDCPDPSEFQEELITGAIASPLDPSATARLTGRLDKREGSNLAPSEDDFDIYEDEDDDVGDEEDDDDESTEEESPDDEEGGLDTEDDELDDSDEADDESDDEDAFSKISEAAMPSPTEASHEMASIAVSDTNAICEDSNTEASETISFPNEEPTAGKSIVSSSSAEVRAVPFPAASVSPSATSSAHPSLAPPNQPLHDVACSSCQHPLTLLATAGAASAPIVNPGGDLAMGNLVASTYSGAHFQHGLIDTVPYSLTADQINVAISAGATAEAVSASSNQFVGTLEPITSSGVVLAPDANVATIMSSMQQPIPPTHQAQLTSPNGGHLPTPAPSSSLTFSQSNCGHGISFATTLAPGTLVVPASNGQLFSLAPTTLDPNNPALAAGHLTSGSAGQLTPEGCTQLLQAAAAAAAASSDPVQQQQQMLQQFAAQGVAIAQVGLLPPQFASQQPHGVQVQQDSSMVGNTVTSSTATAMHLASVQQMQQIQQQQHQQGVAVMGQAGQQQQQQALQIPPILTQLDLLQKQLLLQQQQAQHPIAVGPSVNTNLPQMGTVAAQSCVSTQLQQQQQVAIPAQPDVLSPMYPPVDLNAQTESNHDTALTLACAGGHEELVRVLLQRGANLEHRDKKGFTPLILAATAGHAGVVEILLDHGAEIEAQSERTKDTPLSLACSGGRYEVVEILLQRGAMKEHRNVSDYTPLSLAASGGYVNIIKLLLNHGAEINSRTGSKLGISPLMLAAMNGHTAAVKLLLDMGSDINAQIETNRNTALTLACFQGRHEVVSLLVDRKANIEHRAKTGLTPLMEAASGGYYEVGRVLLDKGADVNAPPVPSSRDTALTIAADKGQFRFVELLILRGSALDVKNKKGNSPLWLAANGGHLEVVQLLVNAGADVDSQDNRKMSCLMAAFRKGHTKVVKYLVKHVKQFPSDQECMRFIQTVGDKDLLKKCHQCMEIIMSAKDRQAAEANKNATNLLKELDAEKTHEEHKKIAAAKKREKKKQKRKQKRQQEKPEERDGADGVSDKEDDEQDEMEEKDEEDFFEEIQMGHATLVNMIANKKAVMNRLGTDLPANGSGVGDYDQKKLLQKLIIDQKDSKSLDSLVSDNNNSLGKRTSGDGAEKKDKDERDKKPERLNISSKAEAHKNNKNKKAEKKIGSGDKKTDDIVKKKTETPQAGPGGDAERILTSVSVQNSIKKANSSLESKIDQSFSVQVSKKKNKEKEAATKGIIGFSNSPKRGDKKTKAGTEETGWKEVVRRSKKLAVPSNVVSRVIGRGGCNINAIREVSGAHIEVEKQKGNALERTILIKGSTEATRQAQFYINALVKEPDRDLMDILPKNKQKYLTNAINAAANKAAVAAVATDSGVALSTPISLSLTTVISTSTKSGASALTSTASSITTSVTTAANKKKGSNSNEVVSTVASGNLSSQFSSSGVNPGTLFAQAVKKPAGSVAGVSIATTVPGKTSGTTVNQPQQQQQQQQQLIHSVSSPSKIKNTNSPAPFTSASKSVTSVLMPVKPATAARQLFPTAVSVDPAKSKITQNPTKTTVSSNKSRGNTSVGGSGSSSGNKEKNKNAKTKNASLGQLKSSNAASVIQITNSAPSTSAPSNQQQHHGKSSALGSSKMPSNSLVNQGRSFSNTGESSMNSLLGDLSSTHQPVVPPLMQTAAEYSPFNNLFSNMAEQVLHSGNNPQQKDDYDQDSPGSSSSRMNFASAVGLNANSNAPASPHDAPEHSHNHAQNIADASKAPGYKMNLSLDLETNVTKAPGYRPPSSVSTATKQQLSPQEAAVQKMASQLANLSPGSNAGQDHIPLSPQGSSTAPVGMTPNSPGRVGSLGAPGTPSSQMRANHLSGIGPGSPSQPMPSTSHGNTNPNANCSGSSNLEDPIVRLMQNFKNLSLPVVSQGNLTATSMANALNTGTSSYTTSFSTAFMTSISSSALSTSHHPMQIKSSRAPGAPMNAQPTGPPAPIGSHLRNRGNQNMSPSQNDHVPSNNAYGQNAFDPATNNSFTNQDPFQSLLPPNLHQSMTLPVIQSNLNPYAPDFTSRHLGTSVTNATHGTSPSLGSMGQMPNLPFSSFLPPSSLQPAFGTNPQRIAGLMDSVTGPKNSNNSNQPAVSLFGLGFQDSNKGPSNPPSSQPPPPLPNTNVGSHLPPPPPPLVMPPSSRHPPPGALLPTTMTDSTQLGGIPNLMNVQPLQGLPAPDLGGPAGAAPPGASNASAQALFNVNILATGSSNFGILPPPPNAPPSSTNMNASSNSTANLDALLRTGQTPSKKDQTSLNKFAATIGMIPPPGSSGSAGSGSPHNNPDKMTKRSDNSMYGPDFSFSMDQGMSRNDDTNKMWSQKSADSGFHGKTANFNDHTGLNPIGSHLPNTNSSDMNMDNTFTNHMLLGTPPFFGNSNGNNAAPSSHFGTGVAAPFGNLGSVGGNANSSGDLNQSLPPFPSLWGGGLGGLKNMSGTPGIGSFQNSEPLHHSLADLPDSNPGNWNGGIPRS